MGTPEHNPIQGDEGATMRVWRHANPRWPERYFAFQATLYFVVLGVQLLIGDRLSSALLVAALWLLPTLLPTGIWMAMLPDTSIITPRRWKPGAFARLGPDLQRQVGWHNRAVLLVLLSALGGVFGL